MAKASLVRGCRANRFHKRVQVTGASINKIANMRLQELLFFTFKENFITFKQCFAIRRGEIASYGQLPHAVTDLKMQLYRSKLTKPTKNTTKELDETCKFARNEATQ